MNKEREEEKMTESNETIELSPEDKSTKDEKEVQILKDKINELENKCLRALADYQNLQKRATQEKEDLYKYAAEKTIEVLLPAFDTFDYARGTVKVDAPPEKIIEDFNLVFEMFIKSLKDIGLETIEETGIPFDPVYHEPLHQIPTNELPDHTVMQILKKGYILNKKIIRPALVAVSVKKDDI